MSSGAREMFALAKLIAALERTAQEKIIPVALEIVSAYYVKKITRKELQDFLIAALQEQYAHAQRSAEPMTSCDLSGVVNKFSAVRRVIDRFMAINGNQEDLGYFIRVFATVFNTELGKWKEDPYNIEDFLAERKIKEKAMEKEKMENTVNLAAERFSNILEYVGKMHANERFTIDEFIEFCGFAAARKRQDWNMQFSNLYEDHPLIVGNMLNGAGNAYDWKELEEFLCFLASQVEGEVEDAPLANTKQYINGVKMTEREIQFAEYCVGRFNEEAWLTKHGLTLSGMAAHDESRRILKPTVAKLTNEEKFERYCNGEALEEER